MPRDATKILRIAFAVILFLFTAELDAQSTDRSQDERAIRDAAGIYQRAFNKGDAKTLGSLWVADGEYLDQTGFLMRGRGVISKAFEGFFEKNNGVKIEINIGTIKFLSDNVISEIGTTTSTTADGQPPVESRYSIVHSKRDGIWLMLSVHELPPYPPSNYEHLQDLEWLIGNWIDEPKSADSKSAESKNTPVIHVRSFWSVNRNFIIREFTATVDGRVSNTGTQRIGWHAPSKQIRSWAFDSKGGVITGAWAKTGENWSVVSMESLSDGQIATATETVKKNNDGSQLWDVTDRECAGKRLPDETADS